MNQPSPYLRLHLPAADLPSSVVFDSPHSGEYLPRHFRYACHRQDLMHLHDPHVHRLLSGIPATGSPVLESLVHRSCIDLNRHEYEVDPARIDGDWKLPVKETFYTSRNAGVFPVFAGPRTNRLTAIYNDAARLTAAEGERRLARYYHPYYRQLEKLLAESRKNHQQILHMNMHSAHRNPDQPQADIILGDLNGKACDRNIRDFIEHFLRKSGYSVDFNGTFFSGGATIQKTNNVPGGINSIQVEIARDLYMDQETLAYLPHKAVNVQKTLTALSQALQGYMADRNAPSPKT